MTREELQRRIEIVEESYEFFLAYAARGLSGDGADDEVRQYLHRTDEALTGLAHGFTELVEQEKLSPAEPYHATIGVLKRDAQAAQAAVQLVLAQSAIGSQLIDNLNASIHVRALLTDLFLLDEVLN